MPRDPTNDERLLLQALLGGAGGSDELKRWIDLVGRERVSPAIRKNRGRARGHKYWEADRNLVLLADFEFRALGCKPSAALRNIADRYWRKELCASVESLSKRLLTRLRPVRHTLPNGDELDFWPARYSIFENLEITKALSLSRQRKARRQKN